jgi:iron complex transport system permease protein
MIRSHTYRISVMAGLIVLLGIVVLLSFYWGRMGISWYDWCFKKWTPVMHTVFWEIRFPRIFGAMIIGGTMAFAGASYQGLFQNPMVSPDILGASAGAGFGAAMAILSGWGVAQIQGSSFILGLVAVFLSILVSHTIARGENSILILVLTGMVISTLFASLISITKFMADPESKLPAITFWLMGSLAGLEKRNILVLAVLSCTGTVPLLLLRWKMNVLSMGDEEARAMGLNVSCIRMIIILSSTLLTASSVSVCGMVGWIGLVVPHMARFLVGPNFQVLIPTSGILGALFLLVVDDIARCMFPVEVPLGILTALIGAPFFLYLLMKSKRSWL